MNEPLKVGDTVRLMSGGPTMTVSYVRGDEVLCVWFDDKNTCNERQFIAGTLLALTRAPANHSIA